MSCPNCQSDLIKTKAGSMCLECGHVVGLKPIKAREHKIELPPVVRTEDGHPIPEVFLVGETEAEDAPKVKPKHATKVHIKPTKHPSKH